MYIANHLRSLSRDNKYTIEKEQVIKLIRSIVEVGSIRRDSVGRRGSVPLSESVMRAVVAVAEYAEDPFRSICVQTLAEIRECTFTCNCPSGADRQIVLIDIDLVSKTGGIRFLLHALGDGPL